jgi:calcineurin-like phosphoesterase family protein
MAIFFTADTHFGDHRTINIHKRPFASTAEMDETLISRWSDAVGPRDTIWHLGDVARKPGDVAGLLRRLNGEKHLLLGNNDPAEVRHAEGWASVGQYAEVEAEGRMLVLCHYPFRSWNGQHRGSINLHGHSHGRPKAAPGQYDVGVEGHRFRPVSLDRLLG